MPFEDHWAFEKPGATTVVCAGSNKSSYQPIGYFVTQWLARLGDRGISPGSTSTRVR
jgi:hypothetical protein